MCAIGSTKEGETGGPRDKINSVDLHRCTTEYALAGPILNDHVVTTTQLVSRNRKGEGGFSVSMLEAALGGGFHAAMCWEQWVGVRTFVEEEVRVVVGMRFGECCWGQGHSDEHGTRPEAGEVVIVVVESHCH